MTIAEGVASMLCLVVRLEVNVFVGTIRARKSISGTDWHEQSERNVLTTGGIWAICRPPRGSGPMRFPLGNEAEFITVSASIENRACDRIAKTVVQSCSQKR